MKKEGLLFNVSKVLIYLAGVIVIVVCCGVFVNKTYLRTLIYDNGNLQDIIWQIQASISLLSITFMSIILGWLDNKFYGIPVKKMLSMSGGCWLTYWDKVFLCLMLIPVNLIFVICKNVSCSIILFIISIAFIILMFRDTLEIVVNDKQLQTKAKKYIMKLCRLANTRNDYYYDKFSELMSNLAEHCYDLSRQNDLRRLKDDLNLFIGLLKEQCDSNGVTDAKIIIISNMFRALINIAPSKS